MEKGIKESTELVVFIAVLASATDKSTRNGLDFEDVGSFVTALMKAPAAFENIKEVGDELKDIDAAEMDVLKAAVKDHLDLVDDKLEVVVNKCIAVIINILDIVKEIEALKEA